MARLNGLRVLLVEDEAGIALLLEDMLEQLACKVTASAASLHSALELARSAAIDFAVLDVNIAGQFVFPVAEVLRGRQVPFLFSTGYGETGLPAAFKDCQALAKPFDIESLQYKIKVTLAG